jgi:predicted DNA-binding transcriptional regulator AlpA
MQLPRFAKERRAASCCTTSLRVASMSQRSMNGRKRSRRKRSALPDHAQLSLPIEGASVATMLNSAGRARVKPARVQRVITLEPIFWMKDVVRLTRTHRCTIHRWIKNGLFPPKDAPQARPRGWLPSTIERWQLGSKRSPGGASP